jgi:lipid-binding SYLF domain-containing protein
VFSASVKLALRILLPLLAAMAPQAIAEETRDDIDRAVSATLQMFTEKSPERASLLEDAAGVLVFPDVVKVGFGIGGEYGEGALLVDDETVTYYSTSGSSFGLQAGARSTSRVILFMNRRTLRSFRRSKSWEAGVDGQLALAQQDSDGGIDARTSDAPIIAFVFSNRGVMYDLTLEGIRITPLE